MLVLVGLVSRLAVLPLITIMVSGYSLGVNRACHDLKLCRRRIVPQPAWLIWRSCIRGVIGR